MAHVMRHSAAMELLQAGVDRSVIALWLGHESVETTRIYLDAHLALKEEALAKVTPLNVKPRCYRPNDQLLHFLQSLYEPVGLCRVREDQRKQFTRGKRRARHTGSA